LEDIYMDLIEVLTALSPLVLTMVATYIVIKQYSLDKKRFKLEHFDKRYDLFKRTMEYLSLLVSNAKTDTNELMTFKRNTSDVKIFFDDDINEFIDEIYSKAIRLRYCNRMIDSESLEHKKHVLIVEEESEILTWLGEQFSICEELFIKYLKV